MKAQELNKIALAMVANHKGLLAMDESIATCNKRFAALGIPQTVVYRRTYRELIVTTSGLGRFLNGAILSDETIGQETESGVPFVKLLQDAGIIPGIKVDQSTIELAGFKGERITEGLDGLLKRLQEYRNLGAQFAKWRAVITIGEGIPTNTCIADNAHALARYAAICQQAGVVPIVEPEVLMDGDHTIEKCSEVTEKTLHTLFNQLYKQRVLLEGLILKPNMVVPGLDCPQQVDVQTVANFTINCLKRAVPAAVPGIVFLSGGQSGDLATAHLNAMHTNLKSPLPWALTFSFARAIQYPAIEIWNGKKENSAAAQQALLQRAANNKEANLGNYQPG